ncbi:carnitine dehydratase [Saccharomonospora sp. CUA-673]|uniref:CaiB/BaiF CoA transferase family protein n=1 Tax=Saccharomonospora sp. CUA-673 TaxID=1904969 RepID=UPI0009697E69|nr:CaiB/BaiF CoA-transferase family protein [Saccharomonospora sp. CUA-673]OLT45276.1 carnitine dehydratase [Saccharomonospora sp. CUA-673]
MTGSPLPLDGLVVTALEQAVAAPLATRNLADLGARVIKIERPDGGDFARGYDHVVEGMSSIFVWLNRGKESVQLDLKSAAGLTTLHALLDRSDVVVSNLAPSARRRMGLTVDELRADHPDLIACFVSGYRTGGPNETRKAYDALIQAEAGHMSITGSPGAPAKTGSSIADIAAGMQATSGVLAALRHRDRFGEVLPVEVSLFDSLLEWMAYPLYFAMHGGQWPEPMGTAHPNIAPYGAFRAGDGVSVMLAVQNEREWARLCSDVLGDPDLTTDPRFASNAARAAHRTELDAAVAAGFVRYSSDELVERLDAAAIAWSRLTPVGDLPNHAEVAAPDRWVETPIPDSTVRTLRPTGTPGGRAPDRAGVPALGQHTDAVLAELAVPQTSALREGQ